MKTSTLIISILSVLLLCGCASSFKYTIPQQLNYESHYETNGVSFYYKYEVLPKRYEKKSLNKEIRIAAIKIINNSGKDLKFGEDILLKDKNGQIINTIDNLKLFAATKQNSAPYLAYLLLTPLNFRAKHYGEITTTTSVTPFGYVAGPTLTTANILTASKANSKFKDELLRNNLNGSIIKNGETRFGLIGYKAKFNKKLFIKID